MRPERALTLVADEEERCVRVIDEILQMVQHAAAGEHPVRRDDHVGPWRVLDGARLRDIVRRDRTRVVERIVLAREECAHLLIEALWMPPVDVRRLRGHRRVGGERERPGALRRAGRVPPPPQALWPSGPARRPETDPPRTPSPR